MDARARGGAFGEPHKLRADDTRRRGYRQTMADDAGLIVGIVALLLVLGLCAAAAFYLYRTNFFAPKPPPPKPRRRRSSSRDGSVGTAGRRRPTRAVRGTC